jgi:hypothetical protein
MVVLAQAYLVLGQPGQAMLCLEHAVGLNPRLRPALASEIREALKGLDVERARKRKEQRKQEPIASHATDTSLVRKPLQALLVSHFSCVGACGRSGVSNMICTAR